MADPFALKMCGIQGRLFELAGEKNVPSEWFIRLKELRRRTA